MTDKRKKILFILGVLDSGGVAKSLVNLVNTIDRKVYDVSLLLVSNVRGPYYNLLPADLNIIHNEVLSAVGSLKGLKYLLLHGHFILAVGTILRLFVACFSKPWSAYLLSRLMPALSEEYDLIVDYNGQQQTYYMVDKLKARKKVAFFHSDYSKWPYYYKMDKRYYPKLDAIFTISPICVDALKKEEGNNPTIGLVLCSDTSKDLARYSILKDSKQLFAAKYLTYLPTEEELSREIREQKEFFELQKGKEAEEEE